jgi:cobalt-zinc-cadmium resistance protein CzcA
MNGLPRLVEIRSISRYGLSAVTIVFEDGGCVLVSPTRVERFVQARESIPAGFGTPEMGPVTTGLGDVFQFTVEGEGVRDGRRTIRLDDAPRLRAVPGVTEINACGLRAHKSSSTPPAVPYRPALRTCCRRGAGA